MNIIFLTDLDGTMLSHDNFSCDSIKNDIINLLESGVIIILNSSKTRKEIENFSKSLMKFIIIIVLVGLLVKILGMSLTPPVMAVSIVKGKK